MPPWFYNLFIILSLTKFLIWKIKLFFFTYLGLTAGHHKSLISDISLSLAKSFVYNLSVETNPGVFGTRELTISFAALFAIPPFVTQWRMQTTYVLHSNKFVLLPVSAVKTPAVKTPFSDCISATFKSL